MKSVFEASSSIEAYMIKNLLEVNEIDSEVFGEHLQGGVGDLQAIGIVRVMVAEENYQSARAVINEWEASQPAAEPGADYEAKKRGGFISTFLGFVSGAAFVWLLTQNAVDRGGIDHDGDGELDEKWEYVNNIVRTSSVDQNRDGKFDLIYKYDLRGNLKSSLYDPGFDGYFETRCSYDRGNARACNTDQDNDGFYEHLENYSDGILTSVSMYDSDSKKLKKKQYFDAQVLIKADMDLDGDGLLETHYAYDEFEEIIR